MPLGGGSSCPGKNRCCHRGCHRGATANAGSALGQAAKLDDDRLRAPGISACTPSVFGGAAEQRSTRPTPGPSLRDRTLREGAHRGLCYAVAYTETWMLQIALPVNEGSTVRERQDDLHELRY